MNLTTTDIENLPLPACAIDDQGTIIAATPEWEGALPGAVAYQVRRNQLIIATARPQPECEVVLAKLLDAIDNTASQVSPIQARRVIMLGASLRIIAGRMLHTSGSSIDTLEYARAGISARTGLQVTTEKDPPFNLACPEIAALVLVQFASNAERHAHASSITISARENIFSVSWPGTLPHTEVNTGRQRVSRDRWGMGFARIAADSIGGAVYPLHDRNDGSIEATLEVGLNRLSLPLAAVRDGAVLKATRPWDEETGYQPGRELAPNSKLSATVLAAERSPGEIVVTEGWWARATRGHTWVAIPPDDILDRARDVVDGMVHERALWEGVPEPAQSRVFALASLLGALLGTPLPRVTGDTWNRKYPELGAAFAVPFPPPAFDGLGAIDPRIVAFLASEFGEGFEVEGDNMFLRIHPERLSDPFVRVFVAPDDNALKLT